jgi:3-methyladenine DNA glycosylase Mpg
MHETKQLLETILVAHQQGGGLRQLIRLDLYEPLVQRKGRNGGARSKATTSSERVAITAAASLSWRAWVKVSRSSCSTASSLVFL